MKFSRVLVIVSMLLAGISSGTAEAVMVDFELPDYTAGSTFDGVDGWDNYPNYAGSVVVTPGGGDTTVLSGSQSGRITGIGQPASLSIMARQFDAGPTEFGTGSIISGHMMASGGAGGRAEFFYSDHPYQGTSPCGISVNIGGNFDLYGKVGAGADYIATTTPFLSNKDYLLELELNLDDQSFNAYATNVTDAGSRVLLGSASMQSALPISPGMYATSGHAIVTRGNAIAVYDDLDVYIVAPNPTDPLLPEPVDFEDSVYVAGSSVLGVDGWTACTKYAPDTVGVITGGDVLAGTKSLQALGTSILQRNFGEGTVFDDGYIISTKMAVDGPDGSHGDFYFSHDQLGLATPGGIYGTLGGDFAIFGKNITVENVVACEANVEYLLEMQLNLQDQTFASYVTNLTAGGERTLLGEADFYAAVAPGDGTNAGYVLITGGEGAVVLYDDLDCQVPEPTTLTALVGLILGTIVCACRRKVA